MLCYCRYLFLPKNNNGPTKDNFSLDFSTVVFSILSFQPVQHDMPTDVVTVRTSGQGKPAIFHFQLRVNFSGFEPVQFWSKCSVTLGSETRKDLVLWWWKRGTSGGHVGSSPDNMPIHTAYKQHDMQGMLGKAGLMTSTISSTNTENDDIMKLILAHEVIFYIKSRLGPNISTLAKVQLIEFDLLRQQVLLKFNILKLQIFLSPNMFLHKTAAITVSSICFYGIA